MLFVAHSITTLLAIFALGYCLLRLATATFRASSFQSIALCFGLGLLLGLGLGLVSPSTQALTYLWLVALVPCCWSVVRDWRQHRRKLGQQIDAIGLMLACAVILGLTAKILSDPIAEWDARSIWYFHARIVFFADKVLDASLWSPAEIAWSHVDYPKLNAFWAAAWMKNFGIWNEYLPKFSLVLIAIPAILLCIGFSKNLLVRGLLISVLLLRMGGMLWNGYMDGWLAVYAGLSLLFAMQYLQSKQRIDLWTVIITSGICCGLKNEGAVLALLILLLVALAHPLKDRGIVNCLFFWRQFAPAEAFKDKLKAARPTLVIASGAFFAFALWSIWKKSVGISNDLTGAGQPLERLKSRLSDGHSLQLIWQSIRQANDELILNFLCAIVALFCALNWQVFLRRKWALAAFVSTTGIYLLVLLLVYLTTPHNLNWHLATSVGRTVLVLNTCIVTGLIGLLLVDDRRDLVDHLQYNNGISSEISGETSSQLLTETGGNPIARRHHEG